MSPDLEAILKRYFWWAPRRPAFYFSAIWVGTQIAAYALAVGIYLSGAKPDEIVHLILTSPALLWSDWLCPNGCILVLAAIRFARLEQLSFRGWAIFTGLQALCAMAHGIFDVKGPKAVAITWGVWVFLMIAMAYGTWFFLQWHRNRWATEIAMLKAANASRAAHSSSTADEDDEEEGEP